MPVTWHTHWCETEPLIGITGSKFFPTVPVNDLTYKSSDPIRQCPLEKLRVTGLSCKYHANNTNQKVTLND